MPPVRQVLARKTPQQRRVDRKKLGPLNSLVIKPATLSRYRIAVFAFLDFSHESHFEVPQSFFVLDELVCKFICHAWEE
eukprot:9020313-Karenia_brevis.AAC.1